MRIIFGRSGRGLATGGAIAAAFIACFLGFGVEAQETQSGNETGATTAGSRVLLLPDGTWMLEEPTATDSVEAVTDDGRQVILFQQTDDVSGEVRNVWTYTGSGGGPIQVLVARTIQIEPSVHGDTTHCIPIMKARNLSESTVDRLVAEIEFATDEDDKDAVSIMFTGLDPGEEGTVHGALLLLEECLGLSATLVVPFCSLQNGVRCERLVSASARGVVPMTLVADSDMAELGASPQEVDEAGPAEETSEVTE